MFKVYEDAKYQINMTQDFTASDKKTSSKLCPLSQTHSQLLVRH
jgi:hypothetical protein